ncbi:inositol monophosphatase family protein [Longispora sp. K20-0274]|uniref:inositol monophosphatase family protein n=1 Tax=Longispora sp. K20-0274 TaxID=3088255 RepID=UPI003999EC93
MSREPQLPDLAQRVVDLVRVVMAEVRPRLVRAALAGDRGERGNLRHADNFLSVHDLWTHRRYRELLRDVIPSFVYASEEAEPQVIGNDPDPDLCVLVDPLDTSELAVRGLHGYTHVMVYSRALRRPVVSVVGDIFHHIQVYVAARGEDGRDRAYAITADAERHLLTTRPPEDLREALVTNYLMKPAERFVPLAEQHRLLRALDQPGQDGRRRGRIGVDFGSVSLCHVAAGFTDAVVEFAKGFAIWDLSPGHHVLHAAGGVVLDLSGAPIPLDHGLDSLADIAGAMNGRRRFVAAGSTRLAEDILATLEL